MSDMEKTLKLSKPLPEKSVPIRCAKCGKLVKISKTKMDEVQTRIKHKYCYKCFKEELRKRPDANRVVRKKRV